MAEESPGPPSYSDLIAIPGVGPGKARLLAGAGYPDLPSLAAAREDEIAAVRSVGPSLARKIKDYIATQTAGRAEASTGASAPEASAEDTARDIIVAIADEGFPPEEDAEPEEAAGGKWLARIHQALERVADAMEALTSGPGRKGLKKKLSRQIENTAVSLKNLPPVDPHDLTGQRAIAKGLSRLADLFEALAEVPGKKRQKLLAQRLKTRRKKLARAVRR
ncbi:MAG: hypothetical protein IT210_10760 [Armatimonadetes bacterium]|nr:hypothetical protein [Armatimonadota bacterium]